MDACTGTCVAEKVERIDSKSNRGMEGEWIRKKVNGEKKIKKKVPRHQITTMHSSCFDCPKESMLAGCDFFFFFLRALLVTSDDKDTPTGRKRFRVRMAEHLFI